MNKLISYSTKFATSFGGAFSSQTHHTLIKTTAVNLQTTSTTKQKASRSQVTVRQNDIGSNVDGIGDNGGNDTQLRMHKQLRDDLGGNDVGQRSRGRMYRGGSGN